jgi:hypothetical protein
MMDGAVGGRARLFPLFGGEIRTLRIFGLTETTRGINRRMSTEIRFGRRFLTQL